MPNINRTAVLSAEEWPELADPVTPPAVPPPVRYGAAAGVATAGMGCLLAGLLFALVNRHQGDSADTSLGLAIAVAAFLTTVAAAAAHSRRNTRN